ncbi:MAG: response regulator [Burkholderiales bacterium]
MNSLNQSPPVSEAQLGVFIVEDSPIVRVRLEEMLAEIPGTFNAGHASTAGDAIRGILEAHPNVVLLDLQLAQGSGLEVLRKVRPHMPTIVYYMLSNCSPPLYRRVALELGASAYFDKSHQFAELHRAIATLAHQIVH